MQRQRYGDLVASGWSRKAIRHGLSHGRLSRPVRGVYGPAGLAPDELRSLFVRLPPGSVLGLHSAARLLGLPVPADEPVHVIVAPGVDVPLIRGVAAHSAVLPVGEPTWVSGVPCAPAARCVIDLARRLRRHEALPLLDAALRADICTSEQLAAEVARHVGLRGVRQARELVGWADPRPECVQESQLRLVLLDGALPPPEPQVWVPDSSGQPVYRLDLAYRSQRIAAEYDGASHSDPGQLGYDRSRHNWLSDRGWRIRYFTARDLYRAPTAIVSTIRALLAA